MAANRKSSKRGLVNIQDIVILSAIDIDQYINQMCQNQMSVKKE